MDFFKKSRRAFSRLEVLIVVAILGLSAAIFIPTTQNMAHKTRVKFVERQLNTIARDGRAFVVAKGLRRTSLATLINEKILPVPESILGETYDHIIIENVGGAISVNTADGKEITVRY